MAKLRDIPITKADINEYLRDFSDFGFEIRVLRQLTTLGFSCEHSGTYEDPVTAKTRQFDIRARKCLIDESDIALNLSLSVECKNLKGHFPLVMHCMPRDESERYLDLIWASKPEHYIPPYENAMRVPMFKEASPYQALDPVGKSCDQVGRRASQDADLIVNDSDAFDKMSQAINSAHDLIEEAHYAAKKGLDVVSIVVPVLVVPNNRIWSVWYNQTGEVAREPEIDGNIEYYIDKSWLVGDAGREYSRRYYMSHMEIVQIDTIEGMISKYTGIQVATSSRSLRSKKLEHLEPRNP